MSSEPPPDTSSEDPPTPDIINPSAGSSEAAPEVISPPRPEPRSELAPVTDTVTPSAGSSEAAPEVISPPRPEPSSEFAPVTDTLTPSAGSSEAFPAVSGRPLSATVTESPSPRRRSSWPLLVRLVAEGVLGASLVGLLVFSTVDRWQKANLLLAGEVSAQSGQLADQQAQIQALQAEVKDLKERWYGTPALFSPPAIANTDIKFFAVTGTTQPELISSLNHSSLCTTYQCLPDPAAPSNSVAWAIGGGVTWPAWYCYSPATANPPFQYLMVLPQWSPPTDGSVKIPLVEEWNALEQVIYTHESTHVAIAVGDIALLADQSHHLASCQAVINFWSSPSLFDSLNADQNAFHARLRADCRPEIGCIPPGYMGW
jgi:hypothetical protein